MTIDGEQNSRFSFIFSQLFWRRRFGFCYMMFCWLVRIILSIIHLFTAEGAFWLSVNSAVVYLPCRRDQSLFREFNTKIHYEFSFALFLHLIRKYQTELVSISWKKAHMTTKAQLTFRSPLAGKPVVDKKVIIKCVKWFSGLL